MGSKATVALNCQCCGENRDHDVAMVVGGYPIYRCRSCGVGRVVVEGFDPHAAYDAGYFNGEREHAYIDYVGSKDTLAREFATVLDFVRANAPPSGTLLEIGCAYGFFLEQAREHYRVHGVEVVKEAADHARASGLDVKHGVLEQPDLDRIGPLDVVVMLDVIEHIDQVEEVVGSIAESLKPGGTLIITTGDWASLVSRLTGKNWRLIAPPMHLWYFTPTSLARLGARFGLTMKSCDHPWKIVPLELVAQQAALMMGLKKRVRLPKPVASLGIPASLGDTMRAVFTKTATATS